MAFVPEGQADRSLARSAWESATPGDRSVGYGVIPTGVRTDAISRLHHLIRFWVFPFRTRVRLGMALG